ncbi:ACT domain-containing protein ACR8-like protein [Tanacetum coccineum]
MCLRVFIERKSFEGVRLELFKPDKPGLLAEVARTFRENAVNVTKAVMPSSHYLRGRKRQDGELVKNDKQVSPASMKRRLRQLQQQNVTNSLFTGVVDVEHVGSSAGLGFLLATVKELESQLLVERKLARQYVDTKIAEQQMKQQHQNQHTVKTTTRF